MRRPSGEKTGDAAESYAAPRRLFSQTTTHVGPTMAGGGPLGAPTFAAASATRLPSGLGTGPSTKGWRSTDRSPTSTCHWPPFIALVTTSFESRLQAGGERASASSHFSPRLPPSERTIEPPP